MGEGRLTTLIGGEFEGLFMVIFYWKIAENDTSGKR